MAIIGISGKIGSGKDLIGNIIQYLTSNYPESNKSYNDWLEDINKRNDYPNFCTWQIKKFANTLKDIVCILIGCTREQLEDREFKEKELGEEWWQYDETKIKNWLLESYSKQEIDSNPDIFLNNYKKSPVGINKLTPRKLLQLLGTECGREIIHPNIWINSTMADYKIIKNKLLDGKVGRVKVDDSIYPNWIITDLRFINEYQAVKDRGGITIRVNRPLNKRFPKKFKKFLKSDYVDFEAFLDLEYDSIYSSITAKSETELDNCKFDYVIENDSHIPILIEKVREILIKEKIL